MYTHRSRGFTLIELLVVIAIIGILSAVVLASLSTARQKGNDAAIQSDLSTIQTEAEIYYGGTGGNAYGTGGSDCAAAVFSDAVILKAIAGAKGANGGTALTCINTTTAYAISSLLATGGYWCVDSTGAVGKKSAANTTSACPAS
jgi:prepilin-type N-terminal cleavage/methylation domain-containing protein